MFRAEKCFRLTLQISTAKLQLYYDKKDVLWILLRQLAVYYNLLYPYS